MELKFWSPTVLKWNLTYDWRAIMWLTKKNKFCFVLFCFSWLWCCQNIWRQWLVIIMKLCAPTCMGWFWSGGSHGSFWRLIGPTTKWAYIVRPNVRLADLILFDACDMVFVIILLYCGIKKKLRRFFFFFNAALISDWRWFFQWPQPRDLFLK